MINSQEKKIIIESLGSKHISKLSAYCRENQIFKDDGSEYSKSMLSMVLNGSSSEVSHEKLEKAIFAAAEYFHNKKEKERQQRNQFIEKAKSRATSSPKS